MNLVDKHILLGITGGIAAYKSAELLRLLQKQGAHVRVVMTHQATRFVTPMTFQALSGHPVALDENIQDENNAMPHIELAKWADLLVIAPATANTLAKLVGGKADDLLSATCLAYEGLLAVAPAMNRAMWEQGSTQENCAILSARDVAILGPDVGSQACGDEGLGRMLEPSQLVQEIDQLFIGGELSGQRVLITAGPTREPIDPVRYLSNHSSGRMGYALAQAAREAGAVVTLVSGPVALDAHEGVRRIDVETAEEMYAAVMEQVQDQDIFIASAAVADYRVADRAQQKIKKDQETLSLNLVRNPDILARVTQRSNPPFTIGFAAETDAVDEHAKQKLVDKGLDIIFANDVSDSEIGFNSEHNEIRAFWRGGEKLFPRERKAPLARKLVHLIAQRYLDQKDQTNVTPFPTQSHTT